VVVAPGGRSARARRAPSRVLQVGCFDVLLWEQPACRGALGVRSLPLVARPITLALSAPRRFGARARAPGGGGPR